MRFVDSSTHQVQREKDDLLPASRFDLQRRICSFIQIGRIHMYWHDFLVDLFQRFDGQDDPAANREHYLHKSAPISPVGWPPSQFSAIPARYTRLIQGRVESYATLKTLGDACRVGSDQLGVVRIQICLVDPAGEPVMDEVNNRIDLTFEQIPDRLVSPIPIPFSGRGVDAVPGDAVARRSRPQMRNQINIFAETV